MPIFSDGEFEHCESSHPASFLVLDAPNRPFHGDHWFHIGEYYLSRRNAIVDFISAAPASDHLFIVSSNWKFFSALSQFAFFMLLLCLPQHHFKSVSLLFTRSPRILSHPLGNNISISALSSPYHWQAGASSRHLISTSLASDHPACFYGTVIGKVGDSPVPVADWFHSPQEVQALRSRISSLCTSSAQPARLPGRSILFYQRDRNRRIMNIDALVASLRAKSALNWTINVVTHHEIRQPCVLQQMMQSADVFISTHGFQIMSSLFLQPGSLVFEQFPHKYFKSSYFALSRALGLQHRWQYGSESSIYVAEDRLRAMSGTTARWLLKFVSLQQCMQHIRCRSFARQQDVALQEKDMETIVTTILLFLKNKENEEGRTEGRIS